MRYPLHILAIVALAQLHDATKPQRAELEPRSLEVREAVDSAKADRAAKDGEARAHEELIGTSRGDKTLALYSRVIEQTETGGTLEVYGSPLRYWDEQGRLRAVAAVLEDAGGGVLRCDASPTVVEFYPDGKVTMRRRDGSWMAYAPSGFGWDDDVADLTPLEAKAEQVSAECVVIRGLFPDGVELHRTVFEGGHKEDVILPVGFEVPKGASELRIINGYVLAPHLSLQERDGKLRVFDDAARKVFDFSPLVIVDSSTPRSRRTQGHYEWDGKTYTAVVDAEWLRDATYPVYIDPTETQQAFDSMVYTQGSGEFDRVVFKVDMPGINGNVTNATLYMTLDDDNTYVSALSDPLTLTAHVADVVWNEASSGTTINGLSLGTATDTDAVLPDDTEGTVINWDLHNGTSLMEYIYDGGGSYSDTCDPGIFTIALESTSSSIIKAGSGNGNVAFEWESGDNAGEFSGYGNVTTSRRPKLEIEYTGTAGCTSPVTPGGGGVVF
ncbi:MAG: hypothetical protein AMXMBFR84_26040 [Candidatus Hydrogenedentota bacterium]